MQRQHLLHGPQLGVLSVDHLLSLKALWPCLFFKIKWIIFFHPDTATFKALWSSCFLGWKSLTSPSSALHCLSPPPRQWRGKCKCKITLIIMLTEKEYLWKGAAYSLQLLPFTMASCRHRGLSVKMFMKSSGKLTIKIITFGTYLSRSKAN